MSTLNDRSTHEIKIKEDKRNEPVFVRLARGAGHRLDHSGPLRGQAAAEQIDKALLETGIKTPSSASNPNERPSSFRLYGWRKDFATRSTNNPDVGPELTRQMLGHRPNSKALEECYDQTLRTVDLAAAMGIEDSSRAAGQSLDMGLVMSR